MLVGDTLEEKAEFENGRLAGTDWKFNWQPSGTPRFAPQHWARWSNPEGYTVGEVDAGLYMATDPDGEGLKDEDGQWAEWRHAAHAMVHIDKLLGKRR